MSPEVILALSVTFFAVMVGFGVYLFLKERKEFEAKKKSQDENK